MNSIIWFRRAAALFAVFAIALTAINLAQAGKPPKGYTALFNEKDLTGWWGLKTENPAKWMALSGDKLAEKRAASLKDIAKHWSVNGEELINDGQGLYLSTKKNYGDFELLLEYKTVAKADSGIYLRGIPQVQIWDSTEEAKFKLGADKGSGGLWNNSPGVAGKDPLVLADKPFGEWNAFRILMVGERVSIWLNGKMVVDHARLENYFNRKGALPRTGPIQLQTHGGEIRWRNIFIREIATKDANEILSTKGGDGYRSAFNGKDLKNWGGAVGNYVVSNGAIQCRKGKGGTVYFDEELADFAARFEFKLPPGGNNGLAIRYPGSGDTAYVGMCELQVLDDSAKKYAKLHPAQYHGSAYAMAPAIRGFQRPVGEWNFQEVTVKGTTIRVELNGTLILNTDLANVENPMYDLAKFKGRLRQSGYFGFAGHGDAVSFRNVSLKSLK
ncbi:MAG: DUF1080 domain-containing protein [Verrucomicrobiota bacterium]|nr:DUF1080 domain-containing protein [Verrucomicrobiota bacterium]